VLTGPSSKWRPDFEVAPPAVRGHLVMNAFVPEIELEQHLVELRPKVG
jgi:hypothetical protein